MKTLYLEDVPDPSNAPDEVGVCHVVTPSI